MQKLKLNSKELKTVAAFVRKHLGDLKRRSGETYAEHGFKLAQTVAEVTEDTKILAAALVHDLPLHPEGGLLLKQLPLGKSGLALVRKMHELRRLHIDEDQQDLDFVIKTFTKQNEIIILRLAHRLSDIRQIYKFSKPLQKVIARESLFMYAPIAGMLGFNAWRREIEEICFALLHPRYARNLQRKFAASRNYDQACLQQARKFLLRNLLKLHIKAKIEIRIKNLYSTYKKILSSKYNFNQISDRLALRIITNSNEDCYRTLGVVHSIFRPVPGRLKDYIGAPKDNGYRSIHTVVYPLPSVTDQQIEIQIRTAAMHTECEFGLAAHFRYKHDNYALTRNIAQVDLLRNLEALRIETNSPQKFRQVLENHLAGKKLIIFDQRNRIYHIKKPATVLDFAWLVYKERSAKLKQAYVNGRLQGLDYSLHDGDSVHLILGKANRIRRKWLNWVEKRASREALKKMLATVPRPR